jgi:hypothetical protein
MSDSPRRGIDHRFALALGVFFASGATGLVYQVMWSRMLTLVIGVSIFAITTVLSRVLRAGTRSPEAGRDHDAVAPGPPTEEARGHLIRAFTEAFPNVTVWQQLWSPVILLVGTMEPLAIDVDAIERRLESKALRRDLDLMGTKTAEDILSYFLLGDESVRRLVKDFEPVRDDRTIVDYTIPREAGSGFGFIFRYPFKRDSTFADLMRDYASWRDPTALIIPDPAQSERVERAREARDQAIRDALERQRGSRR